MKAFNSQSKTLHMLGFVGASILPFRSPPRYPKAEAACQPSQLRWIQGVMYSEPYLQRKLIPATCVIKLVFHP